MKASVIIPAYNEELTIEAAVKDIRQVLSSSGIPHEVIVVDDGSIDETAELAGKAGARVLRHPRNMGKGAAVRTGIASCTGNVIVIQDADLTIPASYIPLLIERIEKEGYDITNASRLLGRIEAGAMPLHRKLGNMLFAKLIGLLTGQRLTDTLSGQKAFKAEIFQGWTLETDSWPDFEIIFRAWAAGYRTAEVPVLYTERRGRSKMKALSHGLNLLLQIPKWYLRLLPQRIARSRGRLS